MDKDLAPDSPMEGEVACCAGLTGDGCGGSTLESVEKERCTSSVWVSELHGFGLCVIEVPLSPTLPYWDISGG